jgi:hypothetical protein
MSYSLGNGALLMLRIKWCKPIDADNLMLRIKLMCSTFGAGPFDAKQQ